MGVSLIKYFIERGKFVKRIGRAVTFITIILLFMFSYTNNEKVAILHDEKYIEPFSEKYEISMNYLYEVTDLIMLEEKISLITATLVTDYPQNEDESYILVEIYNNHSEDLKQYTKHIYQEIGNSYPLEFEEYELKGGFSIEKLIVENIDNTKKTITVGNIRNEFDNQRILMKLAYNSETISENRSGDEIELSEFKIGDRVFISTGSQMSITEDGVPLLTGVILENR